MSKENNSQRTTAPLSKEKFADLHLHTVFSDSTYTPLELISASIKFGLCAIAVVDHDNVGGIEPTLEIAKRKDIEVIPGIELTAEFQAQEIHILGYFINYKSKELIEKLDFLKKNRIERVYKIVDRLKDMGIELKAQDIFDLAKDGTVGRLHIARVMVRQGWVSSAQEAFQRYIGDKCPAFLLGFRFSPYEAIKLIKDVGGIAVLAHPYILNNFAQGDLITSFIDYGLRGIEVYYPEHTASMTNFYLDLAKKYNLLVTGGSDCHGNAKPEVKIGSVKIPYDLVQKLKRG